eukprot:gnl/MRDRNA2_/MRDRNA2_77146_c0_seq1.p1 gnl/MRDRNA2_/MRDRNA2_77146_c0~~gnl/MRDRNA2_/MRDRNA2_77146_c0_seq1.p1  ORF type:complete len:646 (-),score=158.91 gnl/MRDRNA2_/MRDRNA2_77146_c0_seq1:1354-3291(-)
MSYIHKARSPRVGRRAKGASSAAKIPTAWPDKSPALPLVFQNSGNYFQHESLDQSASSWCSPVKCRGEIEIRPQWNKRHHVVNPHVLDNGAHYRQQMIVQKQLEIQHKQEQRMAKMLASLPHYNQNNSSITHSHIPSNISKQQQSLSARLTQRPEELAKPRLQTLDQPQTQSFSARSACTRHPDLQQERLPSAETVLTGAPDKLHEEDKLRNDTTGKIANAAQLPPLSLTHKQTLLLDPKLDASTTPMQSAKEEEPSLSKCLPTLSSSIRISAWTAELKSTTEESSIASDSDAKQKSVQPNIAIEKGRAFNALEKKEDALFKSDAAPDKQEPQGVPKGPAFAALERKVAVLENQPASQASLTQKKPAAQAPQNPGMQQGPAFLALQKKIGAPPIDENSLEKQKKIVDKMIDDLMSKGCLVPFSQEEKDVLFGFFELHDDDGSQSLSLEELVGVTDDIGRAPAEGSDDARQFEKLMRKADVDASGELNFEEFTNFLAEYYQSVYARLFVENDMDKSGTITTFELKGLMVKVKDCGFKVRGEDIADMFSNIDLGGDGILDWEEFCDFMMGYRKLEFDLLKVSAGFTATELEYLQSIFERADADGSGQLSIQEVLDLLEKNFIATQVTRLRRSTKSRSYFPEWTKTDL